MIKRCPTCNRTYSDESISFCLADGALLSAPIEPSTREPPPTEILKPPRQVPPTRPATPTSPTLPFPASDNRPFENRIEPAPETGSSRLVWVVFGLIMLALAAGGFLFIRQLWKEPDTASTNPGIEAATPATSPVADASITNNASPKTDTTLRGPSATPSNVPAAAPVRSDSTASTSNTNQATLKPDPALFPPADSNRNSQAASSPATDYNQVFSNSAVDTRMKILSKPGPIYTESARVNQVQGVVTLRAVFSASGQVTNISVLKGLPNGLSEQAIAAARQIKFIPAMKDGRAVSVSMVVEYNFNLY